MAEGRTCEVGATLESNILIQLVLKLCMVIGLRIIFYGMQNKNMTAMRKFPFTAITDRPVDLGK
jgi:hypothetical protein